MTFPRRLRIFLASPGDVGQERSIAREILAQLPYDALVGWRVAFEVVAWDQPGSGPPMLATMTPQAAIDAGLPRPSECDVVVVILWSRMGTPLPDDLRKPDGTRYRSGTEWEFLDALQASRRSGRPLLLVYRRVPPCPLDEADPRHAERLAQREQVQAFFAGFSDPDGTIRAGVNEYADPADFRRLFEQHCRGIVARVLAEEGREAGASPPAAVGTSGPRDPAERSAPPKGPAADEGPATSPTTAVFVGSTRRGPLEPRYLTAWAEFERIFGQGLPSEVSFLAHAVRGFFDNGGGCCWVVRVLGTGASTAMLRLASAGAAAPGQGHGDDALVFEAESPGTWANRLGVRVQPGTRRGLRLTVVEETGTGPGTRPAERELEDWDNLGLDPAGTNFVAAVVNEGRRCSRWLRCTGVPLRFEPPVGGQLAWLSGGADGAPPGTEDYCGRAPAIPEDDPPPWPTGGPGRPWQTPGGLRSTETTEDAALLCLPDHVHERLAPEVRRAITQEAVAQCERSPQRLALLGVERGQGDPKSIRPGCDSAAAALFAPWVCVDEFGHAGVAWVPAVGHVAGVLARTDFERGVHASPVHEPLRGLARDADGRSVEFDFGPDAVDTLTRLGINVLGVDDADRDKAGDAPVRLRTAITASSDLHLQSLPTRRLVRFVGASIWFGMRWTAFEFNDESLWRKLTGDVSGFLEAVWSSGALCGRTPEEAYFVRCDRTTMTQNDIDNGRVVVLVGLAVDEPGAWVTLQVTSPAQPPGEATPAEAAADDAR